MILAASLVLSIVAFSACADIDACRYLEKVNDNGRYLARCKVRDCSAIGSNGICRTALRWKARGYPKQVRAR